MISNKEKYRELCADEALKIPVFMQDWWLDIVCEEGEWDVLLYTDDNTILAAWPIFTKKKYFLKVSTMPPLTPFLGPIIFYPPNQTYNKKSSLEKKIYQVMSKNFMQFSKDRSIAYGIQNLNKQVTNFLPFYWQQYKQSNGCTYQLKRKNSHDDIRKEYKYLIRRRINKQNKEQNIKINRGEDIDKFLELNIKTFGRQSMNLPYSETIVRGLDKACSEKGCRKIFFAVDNEGNYHASLYLIFDHNNSIVYYLMSGSDPEYRKSDALTLLMDTAIEYSFKQVEIFDFEGSMIKKIAHFFSAFGAKQTSYHILQKPFSYSSAFLLNIKSLIKDIKSIY